jgi:hypothetical protein
MRCLACSAISSLQLALAMEHRERPPVIAVLFEAAAVLAGQLGDLRDRAGALVLGHRLVGVALSLGGAPEA